MAVVDLRGDGTEQFVLLWLNHGRVYKEASGAWTKVADLYGGGGTDQALIGHLSASDLSAAPRVWQDRPVLVSYCCPAQLSA